MMGAHKASILPLSRATTQNIDALKHSTEKSLAPTLNAVAPHQGSQHLERPYGDLFMLLDGPVQHLVSEFLHQRTRARAYTNHNRLNSYVQRERQSNCKVFVQHIFSLFSV